MFTIIVTGAVVSLIAGVIVPLMSGQRAIVGILMGIAMFGVGTGEAALSYPIAHSLSKASAVEGYHEYLNGKIVDKYVDVTECHKDGNCVHTYDCSETTTYVDSDGKTQTKTDPHTCPYATREITYGVIVKAYKRYYIDIDDHVFEPKPHKWGFSLWPLPSNVQRGPSDEWIKRKRELDRGFHASATVPHSYANYILAEDTNLYRQYSDDIQALLDAKILVPHTLNLTTNSIHDTVVADKVVFSGFVPPRQLYDSMQNGAMDFNAGFGTDKQGDLHIAAFPASKIPAGLSEFQVAQAFKAYWLNNMGKYAFPKNGVGIIVALSDDHRTVVWARAFTGMPPAGNEGLINRFAELGSKYGNPVSFDAQSLFGTTTATIEMLPDKTEKGAILPTPVYHVGHGVIPDIAYHGPYAFVRSCMECKDPEEKGKRSYVGLADLIPISTGGKFAAVFINLILMVMASIGLISLLTQTDRRGYSYRY